MLAASRLQDTKRIHDFFCLSQLCDHHGLQTQLILTHMSSPSFGFRRAKRLVGQGLDPTEFAKRPPAHYGGAAAHQPTDISWIPERKAEDLAQM